MIEFNDICKIYRVARRESGLGNAVKSLFKREYNTINAINHISFSIDNGEMVGYIGPNGAGKSSTIKILSGILMPDSGTCLVNGQVPWKDRKEYVRQIGVVFGQRSQLWWDIPVIDSFELLQAIYSIPTPKYRNKLDELTQLLHLEEILKTPTRQLSLGQRMRCEIAASLLHEPKLLFLDEPTIGLDAVSKIAVRDFIKKMNEEHKTTVILTTHDMQDIEAITRRVILIGKGQKLLDGTLEDLRLEAASVGTENGDYETDIDHIIASLYTKLNIM
ncbi:ABC transporter ATP-binding protein NatA [Lachnospiraceae bacterium]|nr:ABC transporter ATP-binding protein NatA [Lachnospiraceae bacterium]